MNGVERPRRVGEGASNAVSEIFLGRRCIHREEKTPEDVLYFSARRPSNCYVLP